MIRDIQVVNSTTAKLHNRDEYCHASISDEMAKLVYDVLDAGEAPLLPRHARGGAGSVRRDRLRDVDRDSSDRKSPPAGSAWSPTSGPSKSSSRLVRDYSGLHSLMSDMDVLSEVDFDWGLAEVKK